MSIELYTFILSCSLYFILYLFPGFIALGQGFSGISGSLFDVPRFFPLAFNYAVGYIVVFVLSFLALTKIVDLKYWWRQNDNNTNTSLLSNLIMVSFDKRIKKVGFLCLFIAIVLSSIFLDFNQLFEPTQRHFSRYNHIQDLVQFLSLFSMCLFLFANYSYKLDKFIFVFISLCNYLLYPLAHSSRSIAIPFLPISLYFLFNKDSLTNKIFALLTLYLGIIFYVTSLVARSGDVGIIQTLDTFFRLLMHPDFNFLYEAIDAVSPGISTTSLALKMFENSESYGFFPFLRYVSPLPSFVFPILDSSRDLGFTNYVGATGIGLNTDIISEWIFWFGSWGYLAGGFFLALLNAIPIFLRKKQILTLDFLRFLFLMSTLLYISAGSAMSVRAASRLYLYVLVLTLVYHVVQKKSSSNVYKRSWAKKKSEFHDL